MAILYSEGMLSDWRCNNIRTFPDLGEVHVAVGDAVRVPHHGVVAGQPVDGGELLLVGRHSEWKNDKIGEKKMNQSIL